VTVCQAPSAFFLFPRNWPIGKSHGAAYPLGRPLQQPGPLCRAFALRFLPLTDPFSHFLPGSFAGRDGGASRVTLFLAEPAVFGSRDLCFFFFAFESLGRPEPLTVSPHWVTPPVPAHIRHFQVRRSFLL